MHIMIFILIVFFHLIVLYELDTTAKIFLHIHVSTMQFKVECANIYTGDTNSGISIITLSFNQPNCMQQIGQNLAELHVS